MLAVADKRNRRLEYHKENAGAEITRFKRVAGPLRGNFASLPLVYMTNATVNKWTIGLCETQPVTAEGIRAAIEQSQDLEFVGAAEDLLLGARMFASRRPNVLLLDKGFGTSPIIDLLKELRGGHSYSVVWGTSISESEALRFLQSGARGILRKTAEMSSLLACLRAVASGHTWMDDAVFRESIRSERYARTDLTPREQQVAELVEQGLKNREIGRELGIRPGTVKIHLKHIFEKTGVRGRYGLAISGLKDQQRDTSLVI